jgi:hypothetical protein
MPHMKVSELKKPGDNVAQAQLLHWVLTSLPYLGNNFNLQGRSFYICAGLTSLYIPGAPPSLSLCLHPRKVGSDMTHCCFCFFWLSGFPYLYRYMLAQRKKNLSKVKAAWRSRRASLS